MQLPTILFISSLCLTSALLHSPQPLKNRIVFDNARIPVDVAHSLAQQKFSSGQFEIISLTSNQEIEPYVCHLPADKEVNVSKPIHSSTTFELKQAAIDIIQETFDNGNCTLEFNIQAGYWTVGYCFGDKIMQFHEDVIDFVSGQHKAQLPNHVYVLGKFPNVKSYKQTEIRNQNGNQKVVLDPRDFVVFEGEFSSFGDDEVDYSTNAQKFIKHTLGNGEICDLTLQPRSIDIVYKCDEDFGRPGIIDIQEIKTCQYQMIVNVPGLCRIEEFRKNLIQENIIDITCKKIEGSTNSSVDDVSYDTFFNYNQSVIGSQVAKVKNEKIDLNQFIINPIGDGFYLGALKPEYKRDVPYWRTRVIAINANNKDKAYLLDQFGKQFLNSLDRKFPSPIMINDNVALTLQWNDSFIYWLEMYDLFGNFVALFKITRDGKQNNNEVEIQRFYAVEKEIASSFDVGSDYFDHPNEYWNFEFFKRGEAK
ncbi:YOS9 [Candida theae]|uniref:Endoplasmic reticulum lectin n=1 Tax=Candida theae TaxID=1198502 RepID=A0AAD5FYD2_9ASCO|nr:YOS9 [Candida theae]KAI5957847.1 YOS9 [Candida theae]